MSLRRVVRPVLAVLFCLCSATGLKASILYSVDIATDELVAINSMNGQVNVVGSLGLNVSLEQAVDLAFFDGRLFGIQDDFAGNAASLYEINTSTGSATLLGGFNQRSEGLTADSRGLIVARGGFAGDFSSRVISRLALDGTLSEERLMVTPGNGRFDADGLGADSDGNIVGLDIVNLGGDLANAFGNITPSASDPIAEYFGTPTGGVPVINDIEILGSKIFGIQVAGGGALQIYDRNSAVLESTISLSRSGEYVGLAKSAASVPEPSTVALCGAGLIVLGPACRRRRKSG